MSEIEHPRSGKPPSRPLTKTIHIWINRTFAQLRQKVIRISPLWLRRLFAPIYDYFDMFALDHGVFRFFYLNRHPLSDKAWRAAQPWPHQIAWLARNKGLRTIVNLRGERDCGSFRLEQKACEKLGIALKSDLKLYSRAAPSREKILEFRSHFETLEYPILIHCKSGADRMGLAGVLYMHLVEGVPVEEARHQLSFRFGHIRQAKTGILDAFFERYLAYSKTHDISFIEWVETVYDEEELKRSYQSHSWANTIVDGILRRE